MTDHREEVERLAEAFTNWAKICGAEGKAAYTDAARLLRALSAENAELRAIVEKLPRTKDGKPVVPGDTVYYRGQERVVNGVDAWDETTFVPVDVCYSSRESAEAARTTTDGAKQ